MNRAHVRTPTRNGHRRLDGSERVLIEAEEPSAAAAAAPTSPFSRHLLEMAIVGIALLLYYLVRGNVIDRPELAFRHSLDVIRLERSLGIFHETTLQGLILGKEWLVRFFNLVYVWGHLPVIAATAFWLYIRHRDKYVLIRNAFLISGAIALVVYNFFPVAPPRLLTSFGFVDTVAALTKEQYSLQPSVFVNPFAAMPSLHFGWNLLLGLGVAFAGRSPAAYAFAVVMPALMLGGIILTGNHYFLDAAAGGTVAAMGLAGAVLLRRKLSGSRLLLEQL